MMVKTRKRWYLAADAGRAVAYVRRPDAGAYERIASWTSELALPSDQQPDAADRPGRVFDSVGEHRHAAETVSPKELVKQAFGRGLAQALNRARREGLFESLVLYAPPRFLAELRKHFDKPTSLAIRFEAPKDLTTLPEQALFDAFDATELRPRRRTPAGSPTR
jgi:protein required for attachment to host cells